MVLAGVLFLVLALRDFGEWRTLARLNARGELAEVKITGTRTKLARRNIEILSYEFTPADGEAVTGEDRFPFGGAHDAVPVMERLKLRSHKLRVRYLPDDPAVNRLDVALEMRSNRRRAWFFVLFAISLGCFGGGVWRCRR